MLDVVRQYRNELEKHYDLNDLQRCMVYLSKASRFLPSIPTFCTTLQEEVIETLFDLVDYPDEHEQTINYLKQQLIIYDDNLKNIKNRCNRFMFQVGDIKHLTKEGRIEQDYNPICMKQNLQYQDLKWELASYSDGYHYDRNEYHQWLLRILGQ